MIIRLYEYFRTHSVIRWELLSVLTMVLVFLASSLSYKEDISDFLPLGTHDRDALTIYQDISGASQIIVIFDNPDDADVTVGAIEGFCQRVREAQEGKSLNVISKFDIEELSRITDFVYSNIPYFLTDGDYDRIDSLLGKPGYIAEQLRSDHELLMFPSGGLLSQNISRDPLNLFTPVVGRLSKLQKTSHFESYEGYIFSPDMKRAFVIVHSPYGNSETENNARILSLLEETVRQVETSCPSVRIHLTGGPCIAVDNASQIKHDSIVAVTIAVVLIVMLLVYAFRSVRNIFLIVVSIAWGVLFALGGLSVIHDDISIIVIGISSVIIGIAVNYPLHLIDHTNHEPDMRRSLKEIVTPLVVGNITTIGAFMALVPLKSIALRDLGLFASLLLLGTILFVLVFLPHMVKGQRSARPNGTLFLRSVGAQMQSEIQSEATKRKVNGPLGPTGRFYKAKRLKERSMVNGQWSARPNGTLLQSEATKRMVKMVAVVLLTVVFAYFSLDTEFDANMSNINYLTEQQKENMAYFQSLLSSDSKDDTETLYIVSSAATMDEALDRCRSNGAVVDSLTDCGIITSRENTAAFITSKEEQQRRLERWQELVGKHFGILREELQREAAAAGFSSDAFDDFFQITSRHYELRPVDYFSTLTNTVFMQNISIDTAQHRYSVVDRVRVKKNRLHDTQELFPGSFDVKSMNSAIANSLSDDFNYIGIVCSAIVFLFLWLSFGRIELAMISFLPMAVSWIWILGLMVLFGIKFNIVNVILATFIFGQGDDYTIFMTEGCSREYAYRKPMLASYKNSIILSALIMFIGIGSLIVAKHPALLSLAEVTIIGMFSVVLMAYLIPPFLFNWITRSGGQYRKRPLTLGALARAWFCGIWWLTQLCIGYLIGGVLFTFFGKRGWTKNLLHRIVTASHRLDLRLFPGLKNNIINRHNETFGKPCVIICNHQSMIDPAYLMALSPRIIIVANKHSSWNPIVRRMFGWLDFYTVIEDRFEDDLPLFERYVKEGYSIAVYVEGERNPDSTVLRFHKGAFMLACRLNLDILPIYLHGLNNAMPPRSFAINPSTATVIVGERITSASPLWGEDYQETTRRIHRHFLTEYNRIKRNLETTSYFLPLVKERYLYKGREVYAEACRALSKENLAGIDNAGDSPVMTIRNSGGGALALMAALVHPDKTIYAIEDDEDKKLLAQYCAEGLVKNICFS